MNGSLVQGDHVSCSRVGGAMRRESSRLQQHAQSLADRLADLTLADPTLAGPTRAGPTLSDIGAKDASHAGTAGAAAAAITAATTAVATSVRVLRATADDLDEAGAALQRYATDLAEGHELGRRAQQRVHDAGLQLSGTRVTEPWGPASAREAEQRRARVPEVQTSVDRATAQVGRARARLKRELTRLTREFSAHSQDSHAARQPPPPRRAP
jgi:hypothetical protein